MNLILVVVSPTNLVGPRALTQGAVRAVITSFMLYIQPRLEPDPADEANALLRILVYNTNKTAFGGDVPQISRWMLYIVPLELAGF